MNSTKRKSKPSRLWYRRLKAKKDWHHRQGYPFLLQANSLPPVKTLLYAPYCNTYAKKIERAEEEIDWRRTAVEIDRQIRALAPVPGAWFLHEGQRIKVFACSLANDILGVPGEVVDDDFTVSCGIGALRLKRLQLAGRKSLDADVFLRGSSIVRGTRLG